MIMMNPKDGLSDLFTNTVQKLDSQIPISSKTFETYINKLNVIMDSEPLSIKELKETFLLLKYEKAQVLTKFVSIFSRKIAISRLFKNCKSSSNLQSW